MTYRHVLPSGQIVYSKDPTLVVFRRGRRVQSQPGRRFLRRWQTVELPGEPVENPSMRARRVLLDHLTPEQAVTFKSDGLIEQRGSWSNRVYVIHRAAGVQEKVTRNGYCIGSRTREEPRDDELLSILLMIRHDERLFLKTAN